MKAVFFGIKNIVKLASYNRLFEWCKSFAKSQNHENESLYTAAFWKRKSSAKLNYLITEQIYFSGMRASGE